MHVTRDRPRAKPPRELLNSVVPVFSFNSDRMKCYYAGDYGASAIRSPFRLNMIDELISVGLTSSRICFSITIVLHTNFSLTVRRSTPRIKSTRGKQTNKENEISMTTETPGRVFYPFQNGGGGKMFQSILKERDSNTTKLKLRTLYQSFKLNVQRFSFRGPFPQFSINI